MYSVSIRKSENVAVPRISPPTFAPATVFVRRIPKRLSGSARRRSHQPQAARSATDHPKTPDVRPRLQPQGPVWVSPHTTGTTPPAPTTDPEARGHATV